MKETVISLLEEGYSPEQIKGRSNVEGFAMVSHETIYRWIWEDKRQKGTLYQHLRRKGKKYNKRRNCLAGRGYIPNRVDIEERPAIVDLKEIFGDLEIDTVIGSNHKRALVTINDPWGNCSRLETLELTAAGGFTLGNDLFANTPTGQINLVLNEDKASQVTQNDDGTATWKTTNSNGGILEYTFKSITTQE